MKALEVYASTRSDAILGSVRDRPLPGTRRVRVVAMNGDQIRTGGNSYAIRVRSGEAGLLVVDASGQVFADNDIPLQGLFKPNDAWIATGDMFRIDSDGGCWLLESMKSSVDGSATQTTANPTRSAR